MLNQALTRLTIDQLKSLMGWLPDTSPTGKKDHLVGQILKSLDGDGLRMLWWDRLDDTQRMAWHTAPARSGNRPDQGVLVATAAAGSWLGTTKRREARFVPALRRADDRRRHPRAHRTDSRTTDVATRSNMNATVPSPAHRPSALRQRGPRADARASRVTPCFAHQPDHRHVMPAPLCQRFSAYLAPRPIGHRPPTLTTPIDQSP
jgi:hypothetical protein